MGVCLVTGGKSRYSGLCRFGVQDVKTTIVTYANLRVNPLTRKILIKLLYGKCTLFWFSRKL